MVFSTQTYALVGLEPHRVICEVDLSAQLPTFILVGLPGSITQESRERIRAAYTNSGFEWPARKVTINLLPAHLPKWGSHYELAMALGVLGASFYNHAPQPVTEVGLPAQTQIGVFAFGELSLSGKIRPCHWLASIASSLRLAVNGFRNKGKQVILVAHTDDVAALKMQDPELDQFCVLLEAQDLAQAFLQLQPYLENPKPITQPSLPSPTAKSDEDIRSFYTLSKVRDEPLGVLAALVALLGRHSLLYAGPFGRGKSMLIRAICESSKGLTPIERNQRKALLSTFGDGLDEESSLYPRPVAMLQTSISRAGLEGALLSTGQVLPGELTRAHLGFLVADELLEFRRDVLEAFRQPLEEGVVRLQRAKFRASLPARFQMLASTNICPCGAFGGVDLTCRCTEVTRTRYQQKLSGPLLDRFDLVVMLGERRSGLDAVLIPPDLKRWVDELVDPSQWANRFSKIDETKKISRIEISTEEFFKNYPAENLSERGKNKILQVAHTIGLLRNEDQIGLIDLRLALLIRQNLPARLKPNPPSFRNKLTYISNLKNT